MRNLIIMVIIHLSLYQVAFSQNDSFVFDSFRVTELYFTGHPYLKNGVNYIDSIQSDIYLIWLSIKNDKNHTLELRAYNSLDTSSDKKFNTLLFCVVKFEDLDSLRNCVLFKAFPEESFKNYGKGTIMSAFFENKANFLLLEMFDKNYKNEDLWAVFLTVFYNLLPNGKLQTIQLVGKSSILNHELMGEH
ncbi:hypothetical protein [Tenuifilum thalassicum]|uniref:Uncharacterized protein n=1 Tax=Tenuifilum thalassicum TaxID=2590900 RepID=A0A7D3XFA3_9BACT|nr:hypothetical protein [Tenuifilum thalassicum]QKG80647.1 hypothetical protein FHG85_10335 [Tenuifilum thalassicum]